jgi:hypothetical protein
METRRNVMKRYAFIPSSPFPLEERITPSHLSLANAAAAPHAETQTQSLNLYGFALGTQTPGTVHRLRATDARISPLGTVSLTGSLVIPNKGGANRPVHGKVTLSTAQGTVTVSLTGTVTVYTGSFSFASGNLSYKIVSGTNAYHGANGTGPVLYGPGPFGFLRDRFILDFGNYPPPP